MDEELHTFEEALAAYKEGKQIRRKGGFYWYDTRHQHFLVWSGDFFEEDWCIREIPTE
jgi:hypothetical protein